MSELQQWAANAAAWREREFAARTAAVKAGSSNIDWIDPDYRVSWSEILHHCPPPRNINAVDVRLAFDEALKAARTSA